MTTPPPHSHGPAEVADPDPPAPRPPKQEQEDASTEITEVAPGVLRAQLPISLPGLGHVNCYLLEDERGVALVDPGLPGDDSWRDLNDRLARAGHRVEDVHTVIITHSHFDHFGGAARLRDEVGADIMTHESFRTEWNASDLQQHEDSSALDENSDDAQQFEIERIYAQRLPWGSHRRRPPADQLERFKKMGRFTQDWYRTPEPSIAVADDQVVRLARRDWLALHTPGHTYDHLCLYDPVHGVVFTGDHVLPTITPHIGGITPEPDPLARFFESLERMTTLADVTVALPAHGHPFADLGHRARTIMEHHDERLDTIRAACHRLPGGTVTDFMKVLFRERAWGDMAESETYAHVEHLRELGELTRTTDEAGYSRYHAVA